MAIPTLGQVDDTTLMAQYPDGASLRMAVDSGEVDYNDLSSVAKNIVDKEREANPVVIASEPEPIVEPEVVISSEPEEEIEPVLIEVP